MSYLALKQEWAAQTACSRAAILKLWAGDQHRTADKSLLLLNRNLKLEAVIERHYCYAKVQLED